MHLKSKSLKGNSKEFSLRFLDFYSLSDCKERFMCDIIKKEDDIMLEIIPYIILIFLIVVLELIQVSCRKSKIKKWILPILSFLLSVYIMIYLISFQLADQIEIDRKGLSDVVSIDTWMMFMILNIPTIIFIITNIICNKLNDKK